MMRTRFTVTTILGLLVAACGSNGGGDGTAGSESSDTGSNSNSDSDSVSVSVSVSVTDSDTDPTTETTVDPDSSSTDPTGVDSSSSGGDGCTPDDACMVTEDCAPGQTCLGCLCIGDPVGCAEWGEGVYGDCVPEDGQVDNSACMSDAGQCLVDDPASPVDAVCFFACEEQCDCPAPPKGFEAQVTCEDVTGDMVGDCFIDCGGGGECPDGMYCFAGVACFFGTPEVGLPPYSDCVNVPGAECEDGFCLVDDLDDPTQGACANNCTDADDCVVPESGDAAPTCADFGGTTLCILDCSGGESCPDGMVCAGNLCTWEEEAPPPPPYGDCANNPAEEVCAATDNCIETKTGGVCGGACTDAGDCPAAPATGDAEVACTDLGAGNVCNLSCAMGETCPDGMECFNDLYCQFATE